LRQKRAAGHGWALGLPDGLHSICHDVILVLIVVIKVTTSVAGAAAGASPWCSKPDKRGRQRLRCEPPGLHRRQWTASDNNMHGRREADRSGGAGAFLVHFPEQVLGKCSRTDGRELGHRSLKVKLKLEHCVEA